MDDSKASLDDSKASLDDSKASMERPRGPIFERPTFPRSAMGTGPYGEAGRNRAIERNERTASYNFRVTHRSPPLATANSALIGSSCYPKYYAALFQDLDRKRPDFGPGKPVLDRDRVALYRHGEDCYRRFFAFTAIPAVCHHSFDNTTQNRSLHVRIMWEAQRIVKRFLLCHS